MNAVEKFNDELLKAIEAAIDHDIESTLTFSGGCPAGACPYSAFTLTVREKVGFTKESNYFRHRHLLDPSWWRDKVVTKCIWAKTQSYQFTPFPDEITVTIVPQDGGWYAELKQHWYSPF